MCSSNQGRRQVTAFIAASPIARYAEGRLGPPSASVTQRGDLGGALDVSAVLTPRSPHQTQPMPDGRPETAGNGSRSAGQADRPTSPPRAPSSAAEEVDCGGATESGRPRNRSRGRTIFRSNPDAAPRQIGGHPP